jgi:WD40 repeat protein
LQLGGRKVDLDATAAFLPFTGVLSPDGRFAAVVGGTNGTDLTLWRLPEAANGAPSVQVQRLATDQLASADFSYALKSLTFSPDSKMIASGGSDGTVKLWGLDGKLIRKIVVHSQDANGRFSPDGRLLLTWADAREGDVAIKLWSVAGELLDSLSKQTVDQAWFSGDIPTAQPAHAPAVEAIAERGGFPQAKEFSLHFRSFLHAAS